MTNVIKLAKFFDDEINSNVRDVLVTKYQFGTYGLYGKYLAKPTDNGWYQVTVLSTQEVYEFTNLRNAVTWCTLLQAGLVAEARRMVKLDLKLSSLQVEIAVHKNMCRTAKTPMARDVYFAKLKEDTFQKKQVVSEINSFINSSMRLQARKFDQSKERKFSYQ